MRTAAEEAGVGWAIWDDDGWWKTLDRRGNRTWDSGVLTALGLTVPAVVKPTGTNGTSRVLKSDDLESSRVLPTTQRRLQSDSCALSGDGECDAPSGRVGCQTTFCICDSGTDCSDCGDFCSTGGGVTDMEPAIFLLHATIRFATGAFGVLNDIVNFIQAIAEIGRGDLDSVCEQMATQLESNNNELNSCSPSTVCMQLLEPDSALACDVIFAALQCMRCIGRHRESMPIPLRRSERWKQQFLFTAG